jgi:hypothetical protein
LAQHRRDGEHKAGLVGGSVIEVDSLAKLTRLLCCRTEAVKEEKAKILIQFTETQLTMTLTSTETPERDITQEMEHLPPMPANFTVEDTELKVEGDKSDLKWTFEKEDEDTLMIRY